MIGGSISYDGSATENAQFSGGLREMCIFGSKLTDDDRSDLMDYLMARRKILNG